MVALRTGLAAGLTLLFVGWASAPADAASFNCNRATTNDEFAICADRNLSERDVEMATLYEVVTKMLPMGARSSVQDDQRFWLRRRAECGGDVACLGRRYAVRIGVLRSILNNIYARGPY
jgi:uncharacterized protein